MIGNLHSMCLKYVGMIWVRKKSKVIECTGLLVILNLC